MRYIINKQTRSPAYLQLYKQIRDDIINQVYPYNSKLPSKRIIAEETGISTITVEHAFALLADEGYVESKERSGYFVIFRSDDSFGINLHTVITEPKPHNIHNHSTELFPFSVLAKTMRSVISDYGENILERSPNSGCIELRNAIKQYLLRSRGIYADCEQIIIGSGSEYLYNLTVELFGKDKKYAVESPSYKKIEQVYKALGAEYEMLPLGNDGIKSNALWNCNADILHISPYRSFPSGVTATASKKHEYLRWASKNQRYIIEDDFESEFSVSKKAVETLFSQTADENVIYMNTFSKTISPALRIGYMVLPQKLLEIFKEKLGFYSCTVPTFEQYVITSLINNGDFERHINRVRRKLRKKQNF